MKAREFWQCPRWRQLTWNSTRSSRPEKTYYREISIQFQFRKKMRSLSIFFQNQSALQCTAKGSRPGAGSASIRNRYWPPAPVCMMTMRKFSANWSARGSTREWRRASPSLWPCLAVNMERKPAFGYCPILHHTNSPARRYQKRRPSRLFFYYSPLAICWRHSAAYKPFLLSKLSCEPCSTSLPFSKT